jgi:hypothetical protein
MYLEGISMYIIIHEYILVVYIYMLDRCILKDTNVFKCIYCVFHCICGIFQYIYKVLKCMVAHSLVGSTQDVGHSTLLLREMIGRQSDSFRYCIKITNHQRTENTICVLHGQ